ncbi:hypothetical protein ACFLRM_06500 [Acidobacteriota bacterium]
MKTLFKATAIIIVAILVLKITAHAQQETVVVLPMEYDATSRVVQEMSSLTDIRFYGLTGNDDLIFDYRQCAVLRSPDMWFTYEAYKTWEEDFIQNGGKIENPVTEDMFWPPEVKREGTQLKRKWVYCMTKEPGNFIKFETYWAQRMIKIDLE